MDLLRFALDLDLPRLASCFLPRAWFYLVSPWTWTCLILLPASCLAHEPASLHPGPRPALSRFLLPALHMDLPHLALDLEWPRLASCFLPSAWTCLALPCTCTCLRLASYFLPCTWTCLTCPGTALPCFLLPASRMDLPRFALDLDLPHLTSCFLPPAWTCLALPWIWTYLASLPDSCLAYGPASLRPVPGPVSPRFLLPASLHPGPALLPASCLMHGPALLCPGPQPTLPRFLPRS